jgi:hypothetical protein
MAATVMGLSTLGITFGYGVESTAGTKPASFTQLDRINNIGGISMDVEQIDASALEDTQTKYVAGRADTGGQWTVTVNFTDETATEWENLITAYNTAQASGLNLWFETILPNQSDAFFVVAQPPQQLPMPEIGQNELLTLEIVLTVVEYKGWDTKVSF